MNEFNVLIGDYWNERDKDLFFGPLLENDRFVESQETKWPQLLKSLGLFKTTSQAKGAGWDRSIPEGWTDLTIGKKRTRLCILKLTEAL